MIKDYMNYALQSLSHRRLRSWLTMVGIFIGIASVISLIGLGEGLRIAITSQFGFLGTDVLSVQASGLNSAGPPGAGAITPLSDKLVDKIKKLNGVDKAYNRYVRAGRVVFNNQQEIIYVISVALGQNRKVYEEMFNLKIEQGRLLKDGDIKGVVIGNDFTKADTFGKAIKAGDSITINGVKYIVIGILAKKGSFIFDRSILMNDNALKNLFGDKGTADTITIKVKDVQNIGAVQLEIENLLRKERKVKVGEEDFTVESSQKSLETLNSALFAVQLFVYIIAGISLVVGGIGIMNTMYTAVLERTKEIGIMKAIGARNSAIFTMFFVESGFLGMVGGIIGILLGMALAYGLAFLGRQALGTSFIQANISPGLIVGSLMFSFILGTFFGVLPAYNASKLPPVVALRSK